MRISRILSAALCAGACLIAVNIAFGQNLSREIVTLGHGVLNSKASILVLEIAVVGAGPTAEDAKVRSASKTEALVTDFRRFGIKPDDWERRLSVARRPIPDEPKRVAFWMTTTLIARLDDFAAGLEMLDRATMLDVASIRFRFESSDPQAEYEKTLKRALADARFKAEALAAEAGVKLGLLVGCEELDAAGDAGLPPNTPAGPGVEKSPGGDLPTHQQSADLKFPVVTTHANVRARFAIIE
jgi:uncharacterized protein YggE